MKRQVSPASLAQGEPSKCIKFSMFFINVLFWFLSILILGIGIYVMVDKREVYSQLTDLYYDPAVVFVVFGGLMFIITFTGCIGAIRENTCLLLFFAVVVVLLFILQIVLGIVVFVNSAKLEEKTEDKLRKAIEFYRDPSKPDLHFLIDTAQEELSCCGARLYTDWEANMYFNCSSEAVSACGVPFSCCKADQRINRQCGFGVDKISAAQRQERIHEVGCLTVSIQWFKDNLYLIGGLLFGVVILQIVTICFATILRNQILYVKQSYRD